MKAPLFERVQDWIFRMDVGFGVQWFRLGMFVMVLLTVILVYTGTQFYGLRERATMDLGQLGRNLALGRGYVTRNIRPVDLAHLSANGKPGLSEEATLVPELWTPPMYPLLLAAVFKVVKPAVNLEPVEQRLQLPAQTLPAIGDWGRLSALYEGARAESLWLDRVVVGVAWGCFVASLAVLYFLARELFDHRVAMMSVVLYMLCDPMLDACVNGTSLAWLALWFMVSAFALVKAERWAETKRSVYWVTGALAVCGLALGIGTLSQYAFACVVVPVVVYVCVSMPQWKWFLKLGVVLGVFGLMLFPWVARNWMVSRTMFGLAKLTLVEKAGTDVAADVMKLEVQRELQAAPKWRWRELGKRALVNLDALYRVALKDTGANFLVAFFFAALLHRFKRDDVFRLRRYLFWSLLMALVWLAFAGVPQRNFFTMFVPVIMIYGVAFFFVMFERLQFRTRWIRRGMVGLFAALNCLPFALTLLPPGPRAPYPPYDGGMTAAVGRVFREEELLASDIPWAVAWYADRSAVLMPGDETSYLAFNDEIHRLAGVYLTQQTHLNLRLTDVVVGYQQFWLNLYQRPNPKLPLKAFAPLMPRGEQVLLSDRARWIVGQ